MSPTEKSPKSPPPTSATPKPKRETAASPEPAHHEPHAEAHGGASHAAADAHVGHGHGHDTPETDEERADRERSERVEASIARRLGRPLGLALAVGGAGVSLAFLGTLAGSAPALSWAWLLVSLLVTSWGLALLAHRPEGATS